jgi:hypothetical protein
MKNFRARRFSKRPIRLDFKASTSVAGTLWIYHQTWKKVNDWFRLIKYINLESYFPVVVNEAAINSLEV